MASALLIRELDGDGNTVKSVWYNKAVPTKLEDVADFNDLVGRTPNLYLTGLGALHTEKRLREVLKRFGNYVVERMPVEDPRITASSRVGHGAVPPINTRGG